MRTSCKSLPGSLLLLSLSLSFPLSFSAQAEPGKIPHGTVELIPSATSIQPGSDFALGLWFHLEPGWHIYWKNPGDSGQPPRLSWTLPAGISGGEFDWPAPKRLPIGPLLDYGYEGDVLLPVNLHATADLKIKPAEQLQAKLRILVCRETCVPGKADLALSLPVRRGPALANKNYRPLFDKAAAAKPQSAPADWQLSAKQTAASSVLLTVRGLPPAASLSFLPDKPNQIRNAAPQTKSVTPEGPTLELKRPEGAATPLTNLAGLLLVDSGDGAKAYSIATQILPAPASTLANSAAPTKPQGLLAILLLAFGGGLILNLMPCVFPVLSIKVLSLLDHSGGDRKTVRLSALVYTFGVLASFWVLVAILLSLRTAGRSLGWGFQLQSPGFVAFLICLLFVLALSLIGAFEIGTSVMNLGSGLTRSGTYASSFFTGVLATVVATPCTAPFMGVAVGFAISQSVAVCLLVFTCMAIGLAAPFLLLTIFPGLSRFLPRPGAWMETMKQVMAFPLFATVIWLLWVLGQQVGVNQLAALLFALLVLSIAGWVMGRWPQNRIAKAAAALVVIATIIYVSTSLTPVVQAQSFEADRGATTSGTLKWEPFSPAKLASYRASGKPVLIDFTAAWCLTCQVNDRVVFHSPEVQQHLNKSDIALLRADWTSYDPVITATLEKFGRSGIPFYVIYGSTPNAEPITLPDGLLTPSGFLQQLSKVNL